LPRGQDWCALCGALKWQGLPAGLADQPVASYLLAKISKSLFDIANMVNRSEQISLTRQQQPHPRGDDREQITRARQAAEALFASKPSVSSPSVPQTVSADQSARKPRVLGMVPPPASTRQDQPTSPVVPAPPPVEIPCSQHVAFAVGSPNMRCLIHYLLRRITIRSGLFGQCNLRWTPIVRQPEPTFRGRLTIIGDFTYKARTCMGISMSS
jgi:hypothetical protein